MEEGKVKACVTHLRCRPFRNSSPAASAWNAEVPFEETQKALLMSEFSHLNFNENGDPGETFEAAEELARKMKNRFDVDINESMLLTHLINKIPSVYGIVKVTLETQGSMTYANLKSKMTNHFVTNIANKVKDDQCLAISFNGYCNWCSKYGHKETECLVKKNGGGRAGPPNNGNKLGRYERVPGNPYNGPGKGGRISYGRGNGGRGGRNGRGRGKGLHGGNGCRYCGSADHWGNECPKNKTEHSYTCLLATKDMYGNSRQMKSTPVMVDSGATSHMKRDTEELINVRQHYGHVYVANGEKLEVHYIGDWLLDVKHSDGTIKGVMFKNVIVVPNLSRDLLSMAKIDKAGGKIVIREGKGTIQKGDTCLPMRKVDNMYLLDYYGKKCEEANVVSSPELWHQRFGHMNYEYLRQMGEIDEIGLPKGIRKPGICATCERAKRTKKSFGTKSRERAQEPLELVHTDVLGPVEVQSLGGARYAIGFTDDYTRWRVVYPMKHKSESLDCLRRYIQDMNVLHRDSKVKTLIGLRSDNGGEYTGVDFKSF
jgi:hypothetical protein